MDPDEPGGITCLTQPAVQRPIKPDVARPGPGPETGEAAQPFPVSALLLTGACQAGKRDYACAVCGVLVACHRCLSERCRSRRGVWSSVHLGVRVAPGNRTGSTVHEGRMAFHQRLDVRGLALRVDKLGVGVLPGHHRGLRPRAGALAHLRRRSDRPSPQASLAGAAALAT